MATRFVLLLRELRLALALALAAVLSVALPLPGAGPGAGIALAADDEDEDEDEDRDSDSEDEDEYDDDEEDEDGAEDGYEQPPYTAGGLFTKKTWPQSLVRRNLMLIGGMAQVRAGFDIDMSDRTAFEVWRGVIEAKYGVLDAFELHAGTSFVLTGELTPFTASGPYNAVFFAGFETAIAYELVDFRVTTELLYTELNGGDLNMDIAIGFPFRYRFNDKVALYALERLFTIQTSDSPTNGSKPDFTLGFSAVFQPVEPFAVIASAQVRVADFNFKDNAVSIPASLGFLFAPTNLIDLGLQFTFLNLKPVDPDPTDDEEPAFFDQRSLLLYGQLRL